jgi:hypothetical protein
MADERSERGELVAQASRRAIAYLRDATNRPVAPTADSIARLETLRRTLPDHGRSPGEVLAELDDVGSAATIVNTHSSS